MTKKVRAGMFALLTMLIFIVTICCSASVIVSYAEEFYSVTVEYLFQDGTPAYEPYVAIYASGTDVDVKVRNPVIPGYNAVESLEPDAAQAHYTQLSYPNISEDHTVKVYYAPDLVPYRVRYYFQNIQDDLYTENLILDTDYYEKTGYTGDYPEELNQLTFEGFTMLPHDHDYISADGSTIYELYYERNYSLIAFDLDGGFGVEPVYAKYNSNYNISLPTKHGYEFVGWAQTNENGEFISEDGTVISEEEARAGAKQFTDGTVPAHNMYYKAIWEATMTKYTVVYRIENADNADYSFAYSEELTAPSGTEVTGPDSWNGTLANTETSEREYYTFSRSDTKTVEGDGSTIINVYYTRNVYKLRYYYARKIGDTYSISTSTNNFEAGNSDNELQRMYNASWKNISGEPKIKEEFQNNERYTFGTADYVNGSENATFYYMEFEAKYDSFIGDLWPLDFIEPATIGDDNTGFFATWASPKGSYYANHNRNNPNIKGCYQRLDNRILIENDASQTYISFLAYWANKSTGPVRWIYKLYVPVLDANEDVDYTLDNINYIEFAEHEMFTTSTGISDQTATELNGFTFYKKTGDAVIPGGYTYYDNNGTEKSMDLYVGRFFYTRNEYTLEFQNGGNTLAQNQVAYQKSLAEYNIKPDYPHPELSSFYTFGGWYTTSACLEGSEFDFNSTMPANGIVLYSKWNPIQYDVTFYNDLNKYYANEPLAKPLKVDYNTTIPSKNIPARDRPSGAHFIGWYYINDDGTVTSFDPTSMPITKSLKLYAEWTSNTTTKYTIKYLKKGTDEEIADPTEGTAFVSSTKTFQAKSGSDLHEQGWWPTLASHSVLLNADEGQNIYNFLYIQKSSVWYTVKYVNAATGETVYENKEADSTNGVVTETAKYKKGFVVDSITKSLVLAASENEDADDAKSEELAKNVITFYYTENSENSIYEVKHYVQDIDNESNYTIYRDLNFTAAQNETVNVENLVLNELTSSGFEVNWDMTSVKGSVNVTPDEGSDSYVIIEIYYVRNKYPYIVNYLEYGTTAQARATEKVLYSKKYTGDEAQPVGKEISIEPPEFYTLSGTDERYVRIGEGKVSITIRVEENDDNIAYNIINVYYQKHETFTIEYNKVCIPQTPPEFNSEVRLTQSQEIVSSVNESTGSSIISYPNEKYKFLGWFNNAEGTGEPITTDVLLEPYTDVGAIIHEDTTFYAVFSPLITVEASYKYTDDGGSTWKTVPDVEGLSATFDDNSTDKTITLGSSIVLNASASDESDYEFIGWYVNDEGEALDGAAPEHTPTANTEYVARFAKKVQSTIIITYQEDYDSDNFIEETYDETDDHGNKTLAKAYFVNPNTGTRNSGKVRSDNTQKYGLAVEENVVKGENSQYTFDGWYVNGSKADAENLPIDGSYQFEARFCKNEPVAYTIFYHYTDRNGTKKTYKKTGVLPADITEINEEFAFYTAAPHESVFGVDLTWNKLEFTDQLHTTAHVYSTNKTKTLNLTYPDFTDNDASNYNLVTKTGLAFKEVPENVTDDRYITAPPTRTVPVVEQDGSPVMDENTNEQKTVTQSFSYWSIKLAKDVVNANNSFADAKEYNRCYSREFNYAMLDNMFIEPVYVTEKNELSDADVSDNSNGNVKSSINFLGYTRDQWSDDPDSESNTNYNTTDKIYIDFIAAYSYNNEQLVYDIYSYDEVDDGNGGKKVVAKPSGKGHSENVADAGIAIEVCGEVDEDTAKSADFAENISNFAESENKQELENNIADRNTNGGKIIYSNNFITNNTLGNKNSVHFIGSFSNSDFKPKKDGSYTKGRAFQILRVYSFMTLADGTVVLSDPIYVNTYQIASSAS